MELEIKEQDQKERQKYQTRIRSYKVELNKQQTDMVDICIALYILNSLLFKS